MRRKSIYWVGFFCLWSSLLWGKEINVNGLSIEVKVLRELSSTGVVLAAQVLKEQTLDFAGNSVTVYPETEIHVRHLEENNYWISALSFKKEKLPLTEWKTELGEVIPIRCEIGFRFGDIFLVLHKNSQYSGGCVTKEEVQVTVPGESQVTLLKEAIFELNEKGELSYANKVKGELIVNKQKVKILEASEINYYSNGVLKFFTLDRNEELFMQTFIDRKTRFWQNPTRKPRSLSFHPNGVVREGIVEFFAKHIWLKIGGQYRATGLTPGLVAFNEKGSILGYLNLVEFTFELLPGMELDFLDPNDYSLYQKVRVITSRQAALTEKGLREPPDDPQTVEIVGPSQFNLPAGIPLIVDVEQGRLILKETRYPLDGELRVLAFR